MRAVKRLDVKGAWIVVSGPRTHDVYLGPDPSFPRCSCEDATYTDNRECRHVRFVREQE